MGKMSQLQMELSEQAAELGFESIEEAEKNGYDIIYTDDSAKLVMNALKMQETAHKEWLKKKEGTIKGLMDARDSIDRAIEFITRGEE